MATTRQCRSWQKPRPIRGGSGPMCAMIVPLADQPRRRRSSIIPVIGGANIPVAHLGSWAGILQADAYAGYNALFHADRLPEPLTRALCWSPCTPLFLRTGRCRNAAQEASQEDAGHLSRWRWKPSAASTRSSTSSAPSMADRPRIALRFVRSTARLWWPIWKHGCARTVPGSRRTVMSLKSWITCSRHGLRLPRSSTMAGSASRTTPRNGR